MAAERVQDLVRVVSKSEPQGTCLNCRFWERVKQESEALGVCTLVQTEIGGWQEALRLGRDAGYRLVIVKPYDDDTFADQLLMTAIDHSCSEWEPSD